MDLTFFSFLLFQLFKDSEQVCTTEVCLTWKVKPEELVLTCKVSHLKFWVKIFDPFNSPQADCVAPFPEKSCEAHYKNGTITQDIKSNITVFEVHGKIDNRVNGIWTCTHGTGRGNASVEVTVLKIHDKSLSCGWKDTLLLAAACLIGAFSISSIMLSILMWLGMKRFIYVLTILIVLGIIAILAYVTDDCRYNWVFAVGDVVIGCSLAVFFMGKRVAKDENQDDSNITSHSHVSRDDIPLRERSLPEKKDDDPTEDDTSRRPLRITSHVDE